MNQKAFEGLREAGMAEAQAVIVAEHTDMTDVLAAIREGDARLETAMTKLETSMVKWLATLVALPVFLLLVALILSVILGR